MGKIGVVHPELRSIGGAEAVCMNILEALQSEHELHLITYNGANIERLNKAFNTDVKIEEIRIHHPRGFDVLSSVFPNRFSMLKHSLRNRYLDQLVSDFDLTMSTKNEIYLDRSLVHYIHHSNYTQYINPTSESIIHKYYQIFCRYLGGFTKSKIENDVFLANSRWTALSLTECYDVNPVVTYPPVDETRFTDIAWSKRESGFLCIGQIHQRKNILKIIDIIVKLRDRGHDVHLHIIGPTESSNYSDKVVRKAGKYDYIHVEGELDFEELNNMICSHKYGIHGMSNEHFGMVIAEMVSGGMIPFVPNGGGQVEIVNENSRLVYDSTSEAVDKIDCVLSNTTYQHELRDNLENKKSRFTKDRFKNEIRSIINNILTNNVG